MSTSAGSQCTIAGDFNKCPAGAGFTYDGENQFLDAAMICPFDSVDQSGFILASQQGKCTCDTSLYTAPPAEGGELLKDLDCQCFICPDGSRFGFAYSCATPIAGPCSSFNCKGQCNGEDDFNPLNLDEETLAPTGAPAAPSAARNTSVTGTAVLAFVLFRMMMS